MFDRHPSWGMRKYNFFFYFTLGQHPSLNIRNFFSEKYKKFFRVIFFILRLGLKSAPGSPSFHYYWKTHVGLGHFFRKKKYFSAKRWLFLTFEDISKENYIYNRGHDILRLFDIWPIFLSAKVKRCIIISN